VDGGPFFVLFWRTKEGQGQRWGTGRDIYALSLLERSFFSSFPLSVFDVFNIGFVFFTARFKVQLSVFARPFFFWLWTAALKCSAEASLP
jgi:hypothetical protein